MRLFVFLHSDFLSRMSHCVAVQCMGILGKCFPNIFTPALADEIIAFQILYLCDSCMRLCSCDLYLLTGLTLLLLRVRRALCGN